MSGLNERAGFMFEPVKSVFNKKVLQELPFKNAFKNTKNCDVT